ncbi:Aquaporin-4 [Frankliniella fusca]|uniref:Aquaporin-4 n=1 Tax=Frankliniella fusca TaxID=407009 RepID=A0AAE1LPG5_9NEOP|nr:Aquaporin-4 [Frankliniella fusca]
MFMGCAGAYVEKDKLAANVYGSAAFGLSVFMSSIIFGPISGAHMNPLVTLVCLAFGRIRWTGAVLYMASQQAGALVGYGLLYVVIPPDVQEAVRADAPRGLVCCTIPMDSMDSWSAVLAEFIVTSILLGNVVAGMANPPTDTSTPAFQAGILVAGICVLEAIYTGASMNPARSVAAAAWNGVWDRFWVYIVGQALSVVFVVTVYAVFRTRR